MVPTHLKLSPDPYLIIVRTRMGTKCLIGNRDPTVAIWNHMTSIRIL